MISVYVSLILKGLKSINDVPEIIRNKVKERLEERLNNEAI